MAKSKSKTFLLLACAAALALALALLLVLRSEPEPSSGGGAEAPVDLGAAFPAPPSPGELSAPVEVELSGPARVEGREAETSVAWPVKVELELVRGAHIPRAKGVPAMGSGATARLRGRLLVGDTGVQGRVAFSGGANAGRVLATNERGEYGALDLYPGLAEVRVTAGGYESVREVQLRAGQTAELNVSYDFPGQFYCQVFDREGKGLEGVDVELDGSHVRTNEQGIAHFGSTPGGDVVQLVLRKEGFATQSARVSVAGGRVTELGRYAFTMQPAASLELTLGSRVGSREDAVVILLPEVSGMNRSYPWHRVSPARVRPGTTLRLDDLPPMRLAVRVFLDGATAEPESTIAFLDPGKVEQVSVSFSPGPAFAGIAVDREGRRLEGARIVCEAPDRTAATLQYLEQLPRVLEEEIVPSFPPGASEARTNFNGEFVFGSWPKLGEVRYLWGESADGKLWGGRAVTSADTQVELVLAPVESGRAAVSLVFPGRMQGLPVVVSIGGRPREEVVLPVDEPLAVSGLATGTWRARATWNGRSILRGGQEEFELVQDRTLDIALPEGAIAGQDADTLLRAGRSLPSFLANPGGGGR